MIFGFIPMAFIFAALNGGPGMGAVATATAFGIGWWFWWMFLLSNTLERMQKILVATNAELPVDLAGTVQSPATAKFPVPLVVISDEMSPKSSHHPTLTKLSDHMTEAVSF